MLSNLRIILSMALGVAVWGATIKTAQAQFGGLQIQIGRGAYGVGPYGGTGLYIGGFGAPLGVGPLSSRAYMVPQYQSGYRGYYDSYALPALGVYDSPFDYLSPAYRGYGYSNQSSIDQLQLQQYALQRQQLELQAEQRGLSAQQSYPYGVQSRYSNQSPKSSPASDLRPGMVLPDGSTVMSVGPISPSSSSPQAATQQPGPAQPTLAPTVPPNVLPSSSSEPKKAAF